MNGTTIKTVYELARTYRAQNQAPMQPWVVISLLYSICKVNLLIWRDSAAIVGETRRDVHDDLLSPSPSLSRGCLRSKLVKSSALVIRMQSKGLERRRGGTRASSLLTSLSFRRCVGIGKVAWEVRDSWSTSKSITDEKKKEKHQSRKRKAWNVFVIRVVICVNRMCALFWRNSREKQSLRYNQCNTLSDELERVYRLNYLL